MLKGKGKGQGGEGGPIISIIGPGMTVTGDLSTQGTIRIEGAVEGSVEAGKAVVLGRAGRIEGDVSTEDAVISGTIRGAVRVRSRLEVQATARIEGEIRAARLQLEEGAVVNGQVEMATGASSEASEPEPEPADEDAGFPEPAVMSGN